jgi:hypothetical protein
MFSSAQTADPTTGSALPLPLDPKRVFRSRQRVDLRMEVHSDEETADRGYPPTTPGTQRAGRPRSQDKYYIIL